MNSIKLQSIARLFSQWINTTTNFIASLSIIWSPNSSYTLTLYPDTSPASAAYKNISIVFFESEYLQHTHIFSPPPWKSTQESCLSTLLILQLLLKAQGVLACLCARHATFSRRRGVLKARTRAPSPGSTRGGILKIARAIASACVLNKRKHACQLCTRAVKIIDIF